jgi:hypothetical protein
VWPPAQRELALRHYAPLVRPASRHVSRLDSHHRQDRRVRQFHCLEGVGRPETHEALAARLVETPHTSLQQLFAANMESALSVQAPFHQGDLILGLQSPRLVFTTTLAIQPHETPQIQATPPQAHQTTRALLNVDRMPTGNSESAEEAAGGLYVIKWGEPDPEKSWKKRDDPVDKQRKGEIFKKQGACLRCKKTRKQCSGGKVCDRCHLKDIVCVRTCNPCWSNKRTCDEGTPCNHCQSSGTACSRPSDSDAGIEASHQSNVPDILLEECMTGRSSAQVNHHTLQEHGRRILGPTAWGISFGVESEVANAEGFGAMRAVSGDPRTSIPTYSQQSTGTGTRHTFANSSSTKVASEDNTLHVPGKQLVAFEVLSDATDSTSNFDEAMYYSDHGSPSPTGVDVDMFGPEDDEDR